MAFPTGSVSTDNLDAATDSPASARADLLDAVQKLNDVISSYDSADGIAALDSSGLIANTKIPATLVSSTGNVTVTPSSNIVKINNFLELTPTPYASLPASPNNGQIAFLSTDGGATTQNKPIYYETTNNRWNFMDGTAVPTS